VSSGQWLLLTVNNVYEPHLINNNRCCSVAVHCGQQQELEAMRHLVFTLTSRDSSCLLYLVNAIVLTEVQTYGDAITQAYLKTAAALSSCH
jgi:hypothetical protein